MLLASSESGSVNYEWILLGTIAGVGTIVNLAILIFAIVKYVKFLKSKDVEKSTKIRSVIALLLFLAIAGLMIGFLIGYLNLGYKQDDEKQQLFIICSSIAIVLDIIYVVVCPKVRLKTRYGGFVYSSLLKWPVPLADLFYISLFFFIADWKEGSFLYEMKSAIITGLAVILVILILLGWASSKHGGSSRPRHYSQQTYYSNTQAPTQQPVQQTPARRKYDNGGLDEYSSIPGLGKVEMSSSGNGGINNIDGREVYYSTSTGRINRIGSWAVEYGSNGKVSRIGGREVVYGSSGHIEYLK